MLKNIAVAATISLLSTVACVKPAVEAGGAGNNSVVESKSSGQKTKSAGEKEARKLVAENPNQKVFRGRINGTSFEMRLAREGEKLSGTYFYTKIGKNLNLSGTIDAGAEFSLKETDASGKTTGEWNGTWKEEANSNGIALEGTWSKPDQTKDEGFSFYAVEQMIEFGGAAKIVSKTIKETDKAKRSEITSVYPEIVGADSAAATNFNKLVKSRVVEINDAYRKDIADFTAEDIKNLPESGGLSNDVGYDITLANDELISVSLYDYTYMGGAHGVTSSVPVNYDLKNDRKLQLADLFEPNSNYLQTISDYAVADLKKNVGEMSDDKWISEGAAPEDINYRSWNLTKKGLMITFDQYQVAAYAAGPQTVIVPYDKLRSVLRKDGVVANLAK